MKNLLSCILFLSISLSYAQSKKSALFIGNSYTGVNNLPQMVANAANSVGDTLVFNSHTPGGNRILNHAANPQVFNKIKLQNWDYVSIQGQSQEVAFDSNTFFTDVYPHAITICDSIRSNNLCSRPIFYTTWGRRNGDALNCPNLPWMCTYNGMDSALTANYSKMARDNYAEMSPVGPVWKDLRTNNPSINLYSSDGSHPSFAGSYVAACTFYTMIFRKDPTLITYKNTLSQAVADSIKSAVKRVVYDNLNNWDFNRIDPKSDFTFNISPNQVQFYQDTLNKIDSVLWSFADGNTSNQINPTHSYTGSGRYLVNLKIYSCKKVDSTRKYVIFISNSIKEENESTPFSISPNPSNGEIQIESNEAIKKSILSLKIYDIKGKLIEEYSYQQQVKLHLELPSGLYFLRIEGENISQTSKIIIQNSSY